MKKNAPKRNFSEFDKFDRKQQKHAFVKDKSSKNKYSIYEDYDEDEDQLTNDYDEDDDFEDK